MTDSLSLQPLVDALQQQVDEHGFIDVGKNIEKDLPVSRSELNVGLAMLKERGYQVHTIKMKQLFTDEEANYKILVRPGTTFEDTWNNRTNVRLADFTQQ
jgi:biotin operon repressor